MAVFLDYDQYTNGSISSALTQIFNYVNYLTNGALGVSILIIVGFIGFISTKNYSFDRSFAFSSFITLIVAILLRFTNLIGDALLAFCAVLTAISLVILIAERDSEGL
jgi:uncharacterized membrane protein